MAQSATVGTENQLEYQCCFCATGIRREGPDIGLISYTTCFDGAMQRQHTQEMFCHAKCLQLVLNRSCPLYVLDLVGESDDTE